MPRRKFALKANSNALQVTGGNMQALSDRHLEYNLIMDENRCILAERAMVNTEILYNLASEISAKNPATTEDLRTIMDSYITSTADHIRAYGNPYRGR